MLNSNLFALRPHASNRLFDQLFEGFPFVSERAAGADSAADLWEDESALHLALDLPGCSMEDVDVTVHQEVLSIRAERKAAAKEKATWHRRERRDARIERRFRLPLEVDAEHVEATLRNGVLQVRLPKTERAVPHKVEVKTLPAG